MRVVQLTGSLSRAGGGLYSALLGLAPALSDAGIAVQLHGLVDRQWEQDADSWGGCDVHAHAVRGPPVFGYAPSLAKAAARFGADLVHCHGLWKYPSVASLRLSRQRRIPRVVSPHGMLNARPLSEARWKKALAQLAYESTHVRGAAMLHALSRVELESIRSFGFQGPICLLPNGVTIPGAAVAEAAPWQGLIPSGGKVLLSLGRKDPIKNLGSLLRAWAFLERKRSLGSEWHLVVAGWGRPEDEADLERLARDLHLRRVLILGALYGDAKAAALGSADGFALVSISEALPVAALEAWAYGLPAIMTDACNFPDGFAAGAAVQVEIAPEAIAQGILDLAGMGDAGRREMGARGRALVARCYAWDSIAGNFALAYRWLLGGGEPPDCIDAGRRTAAHARLLRHPFTGSA